MSRLKLLLFIILIGVLMIVFIQNREPIALKLLCDDVNNQYCLYQTPQLPLAVWIGLFALGGMLTSLLSQVFSRFSYSGSGKSRKTANDLYPERQGWVDQDGKEQYAVDSTQIQDSQNRITDVKTYEASQKPQSVERSGSNYSYKYRPADKSDNKQNNFKNNSIDLDKNTNITPDQDDEDWI
ncbi:hypothetical protein [Pleurocapsa sp. FMAR1]|uniref:hypothetical protein n=1 Tax=Pleurocapsa sp. FMAR1 TaxID=3040204 RepID=UPI0029C6A7AD|nr:hypothetical protein [Pleurocapsa sp. FMAR1]